MGSSVLFYGWRIVAVLFVMLTFSSGLGFYNHAIIIQTLSRQADFPLETASLAVSFFFLIGGLSGVVIAPLLEKYDVRYIVGTGTVFAVLSLWLIPSVTTVTELFAVYLLFGLGFSAGGLLPATTLVARWFESNRARALSIASTGLSAGGILLTPLTAWLVENWSFALSFRTLATVYLVLVLPPCLIVLRSRPSAMGLRAMGQVSALDEKPSGIALREALNQHFFWILSGCYVLTMAAQVGGIAHQYGVLIERLSPAQASFGLAILPACSIVGRLAGGVILEHVRTLRFTIVMMVLQGTSLVLIAFGDGVWMMYTAMGLFGVSVGNLLMLQPLIVAEIYGLLDYAKLYSWSNMITVCGISVGPALMGTLSAISGGYQLSYVVAGSAGLVAAVIFSTGRPPVEKQATG